MLLDANLVFSGAEILVAEDSVSLIDCLHTTEKEQSCFPLVVVARCLRNTSEWPDMLAILVSSNLFRRPRRYRHS